MGNSAGFPKKAWILSIGFMSFMLVSAVVMLFWSSTRTFQSEQSRMRAQLDAEAARTHEITRQRQLNFPVELQKLAARTDLPASHWARQWAGQYSFGRMGGTTITLGPDSGMTSSSVGCMGPPACNYADDVEPFDCDADNAPDGVIVRWASRSYRHPAGCAERFYFVSWDGAQGGPGRHYLVEESRLLEFVNTYNQSEENRLYMGGALCRTDSVSPDGFMNSVIGKPHLPAPWSHRLFDSRLTAKVVSYKNDAFVLDKGAKDGLFVGMEVEAGEHSYSPLTIASVTDHSASGTFTSHEEGVGLYVGRVLIMAIGASKPPAPESAN